MTDTTTETTEGRAIFVRWRKGEDRRGRVFPPLDHQHLAVYDTCPSCGCLLGVEESVQIVAVGPVNEDDEKAHDEGRWYSAGAILLHADCVKCLTDFGLDRLASELTLSPEED